jgi:hypothetical protein
VYWRPVFHALCEAQRPLEVLLVNARHVKNVPGRKSDALDAVWLAELTECGLLRGSFIPPPQIAAIRELTRYRKKLIEQRTSELQRLAKVLEDAPLTELPGRWFVSWVGLERCEATVRPRGWGSGDAAGSGVVGGAAVWVAGGDRRGVRAVPAA